MASINIFKLHDIYIFKQYLGDPGLFKQLGDYYNGPNYRFEIPQQISRRFRISCRQRVTTLTWWKTLPSSA